MGGHLGVEQRYLVYEFIAMNTLNYAGYKIIVDAGNGDILSTSDGIQIKNYFNRYIGPDGSVKLSSNVVVMMICEHLNPLYDML